MPCSSSARYVLGHVAPGEDPRVDARVQCLHASVEELRECRHALDPRRVQPRLLERSRGAAARDELEAELDEAAREGHEARTCRRPRSARAELSHHLGQQPVLDRVDSLAQGLHGVAGEHGDRLARDHSPVSTPSSTK